MAPLRRASGVATRRPNTKYSMAMAPSAVAAISAAARSIMVSTLLLACAASLAARAFIMVSNRLIGCVMAALLRS